MAGDMSTYVLIAAMGIVFVLALAAVAVAGRDPKRTASPAVGSARLLETAARLRRIDDERALLAQETLRTAVAERARVAEEIHDGVVQQLTAAGYGLERARLHIEEGRVEVGMAAIHRAQETLGREIEALRQIMTMLDASPPQALFAGTQGRSGEPQAP